MFSDAFYAPEEQYHGGNNDEFYTPEVELTEGSSANQGVNNEHNYDANHNKMEQNLIKSSDDDFGYVFKPEGHQRPAGIGTSVNEFASSNADTIEAAVGISMAFIVAAIATVAYIKRKATLRGNKVIAQNLEPFDDDDINVNKDPSGGYHGFYSNSLLWKDQSSPSHDTVETEASLDEGSEVHSLLRTRHVFMPPSDAFLTPVEFGGNNHNDDSPVEFGDNNQDHYYPVEFGDDDQDHYSPVEFGDNDQDHYSNNFELTTRVVQSSDLRDII